MHVGLAVGVVGLLALVAACGTTTGEPESPAPTIAEQSAPATASPAPSASATATASATRTAIPSPSPQDTAAGPLVLESATYPYRITLPAGPGTHVSAAAPWDGVSVITRDSRHVDRMRAPGGSAMWAFLSPTPQTDLDAFVAEMARKYASWHRCTDPSAVREFTAGPAAGVSYEQECNAGERFARAVVVDERHGLFAFIEGGPDPSAARTHLESVLRGLEWTGSP